MGEAEVTTEISWKCIELNFLFVLDLDGVPFRHILGQNTSHSVKKDSVRHKSSACVSDDSSKFSTRCTFRQGPWVLLLAAPLVLPLYHAVILVLRFCQHGYHFSGAEFLLSKHTWPFARAGLIVDRPSLSYECLSITLISLFVSLDQRNQSSSRTILWTESFITAIFWLLNIYLTGRTQGKHILTNRMTSCTSLLLHSVLLRPNHLFGK